MRTTENVSISDILSAPVMQTTINNVFGKKPYDVAERPQAFVLSLQKEPSAQCKRIIVLKPKGFSANHIDELGSHPEAWEATIEIKGAARVANRGYFPIKNCVEFVHCNKDVAETKPDYPYASAINAVRELKTSKAKFKVVKRNYYGFYHNLINMTDEWLVLVLNKKLNLIKKIDYSLIESAGKKQKEALYNFADAAKGIGDAVFKKEPDTVKSVYSMDPLISIPALTTLLNIEERGKHEQCTVYAVILRIAKKHPELALKLLKKAEKDEVAPPYYLGELIKKVKNVA